MNVIMLCPRLSESVQKDIKYTHVYSLRFGCTHKMLPNMRKANCIVIVRHLFEEYFDMIIKDRLDSMLSRAFSCHSNKKELKYEMSIRFEAGFKAAFSMPAVKPVSAK